MKTDFIIKEVKDEIHRYKLEIAKLRNILKKLQNLKFANRKKVMRTEEGEEIKCPHCQSSKIIKNGLRYNQGDRVVQKYRCMKCKRKFSFSNRMRHSKEEFNKAVDLYKNGMSMAKIAKEVGVVRQTIWLWIKKYETGKIS